MKKLLALLLAAMMIVSFAACSNDDDSSESASSSDDAASAEATASDAEETASESASSGANSETITITTMDGTGADVELEIPYNPERVAVMDLAALDIIDNIGAGDSVIGVSKGSSIDYLQSYVTDDSITNLGTIKEADMEAVMECEPDVIIIGGRLSDSYDALSEIAPVIYIATNTEAGVVQSTSDNAKLIASLFGKEDEIDTLMAEYNTRIKALAETAEGKTAVIGMVTSGGFNVLGNDGRCSIIGVEIGFENVGTDANVDTSTHGNDASFEFLVDVNPDYIFVMDRDTAIGTEGAQLAQDILNNEIVNMTDAAQNDQIVYLEHPNVWYTAEGGITALDIMLSDLESALL